MEREIEKRTLKEANIIINSKKTLRELATELNLGKSTIHKDMQIRLKQIDQDLYNQVQSIFKEHINIRHLRGGASTKKKYQKSKIN